MNKKLSYLFITIVMTSPLLFTIYYVDSQLRTLSPYRVELKTDGTTLKSVEKSPLPSICDSPPRYSENWPLWGNPEIL